LKVKFAFRNWIARVQTMGIELTGNEAKKDLKPKVEQASAEIESLMWQLCCEHQKDLKLREPFGLPREFEIKSAGSLAPAQFTTRRLVQQMQALVSKEFPHQSFNLRTAA
jgi:hypothetical protein